MNIKNSGRIIEAISELDKFDSNLEVLYKMKAKNDTKGLGGILLQEYSDGSGLHTVKMYRSGNANPDLNREILDAVIGVIEKHMLLLTQEMETL